MPKNISTNFEEFVKKNSQKTKMTKKDIVDSVFECLSKSDQKLTTHQISNLVGQKPDKVYVAITGIKEAKSKRVDDISYWYIKETQLDPPQKIAPQKAEVDINFLKILKEDKKSSSKRKIFSSMEDYTLYHSKDNMEVKKIKKEKGSSSVRRKK